MTNSTPTTPPLQESDLLPDPLAQFRTWFDDAVRTGVCQPHAMTFATVSPEGSPSARIVLMKAIDAHGITFVTNYESRKGRDLRRNARAALVFFWPERGRQVRMEGVVEQLTAQESEALFAARPRENQLSSAASDQSQVTTLEQLELRYEELRIRYEGTPVPRPPHWGGYRLVPDRVEFWQHRYARMNDRIEYMRERQGTWERRRLAP